MTTTPAGTTGHPALPVPQIPPRQQYRPDGSPVAFTAAHHFTFDGEAGRCQVK
jgi:hypothetical protein